MHSPQWHDSDIFLQESGMFELPDDMNVCDSDKLFRLHIPLPVCEYVWIRFD